VAHDLNFDANGNAAMMYVGETPWHGLGTRLETAPTSADAITAAGLDWEVRMEDLVTASGLAVPMGQVAVRGDTNTVLGMVGRRWTPVQNREAFAFLDGMAAKGDVTYHTAGALGRGERVWMLAKLPGHITVAGTEDVTEKYLLLSNAHDGFSSLRAFFTPIRVVCQNTLNMASRQALRQGVTIRHTGKIEAKLAEARRVLGLADQFYKDVQEQANFLASRRIGRDAAMSYFKAVVPAPEDEEKGKRAADNARETWGSLLQLWDAGKGQDIKGVRHTYWAAYNAVTEFVDHVKVAQGSGKLSLEESRMNRLSSIWFGAGADLKGRAYVTAMQHAGASVN
jgi:phage/plasmid-like protein (TIGR03299 family)